MNGICVKFRGWIDLDRLDGVGSLEYDEERGAIEEAILRDQIERYTAGMREVEKEQRLIKERQAAVEAEVSILLHHLTSRHPPILSLAPRILLSFLSK